MTKKTEETIYDIDSYTDKELFDILDLNTPTDRELEAKIIFLIRKYENIQNDAGDKLATFFKKIHSRFFYFDDDEEKEDEENTTNKTTENIIYDIEENHSIIDETEPVEIQPLRKSQFLGENHTKKKETNQESMKEGMDEKKEEKKDGKTGDISLSKTLDYSPGQINPLLKQTIKRIVSVDSQYRDNKKDISTHFQFKLSEPLKDVVSIKLYSVQIPYTWYTISTHYGSNLFFLKGNSPGINQGNNDYPFSVTPGNYTPQQLIDTVNNSIKNTKSQYTDVNFGTTNISYNAYTSLTTMTVDIKQQYNETSYSLNFPQSGWISSTDTTKNRITSIPGLLGYNFLNYKPYTIKSTFTLPVDSSSNDQNIRSYYLDNSNNYFTVYKYIGPQFYSSQSKIDLSFVIQLTLSTGQTYTRNEIVTDVEKQIANNTYLSSEYSYIKRVPITDSSFNNGTSYFELALKPNRLTTNNISNSKCVCVFPNESYLIPPNYPIWTGIFSCFQFTKTSNEMNAIVSETAIVPQVNTTYPVLFNPTISLNCTKQGFDVSNNNFLFQVANSSGYNLPNYISAINNGITNEMTKYNVFFPQYTSAFVDTNGLFNVQFDLTKNIQQNKFVMHLDGYIDKNNNYLSTKDASNQYGLTKLQTSQTNNTLFADCCLNQIGFFNTDLSYVSLMDLSASNSYSSQFFLNSSYTIRTKYLASIRAKNPGDTVSASLSYNILTPPDSNGYYYGEPNYNPSIGYSDIASKITNQFTNFTDADGYEVTKGSRFDILGTTTINQYISLVNSNFKIYVNKPITQTDYSVQFNDISYVQQNKFIIDTSGYINNETGDFIVSTPSTELVFEDYTTVTKVGGLQQLGFNKYSYDYSYDLSSSNIWKNIPFKIANNYVFDSSYLFYIELNRNAISGGGTTGGTTGRTTSGTQGQTLDAIYLNLIQSSNLLNGANINSYAIPCPSGNYQATTPQNKALALNRLKTDINDIFKRIPDLSGSTINFTISNSKINSVDVSMVSATLTINIKQKFNLNYKYSSWYNFLNIDPIMIQSQYSLNTIGSLSYQNTSWAGVQSYTNIQQQFITFTNKTNYFEIIPFEQGVTSNDNANKLIITIPYLDTKNQIIKYNRNSLIAAINAQFQNIPVASNSVLELDATNTYSQFCITINKEYSSKDYNLVFYDPISYVSKIIGSTSIQNTTWDTTLGWIFGFRNYTVYNLSEFQTSTSSIVTINGDTGVSTNLYNYFLICLDDFNQNHLNDGLVTITGKEQSIALPSYASRANYIRDPVTGGKTYNTNITTDNKKLTQKQVYSLTQIANAQYSKSDGTTKSVSASSYGSGPFVQDVFGLIPMKTTGLANGAYYIEFGGTLQNQERLYFGPVNISRMSVKLVSDKGDIIDLNGANWSFSLLCEQLYNQ